MRRTVRVKRTRAHSEEEAGREVAVAEFGLGAYLVDTGRDLARAARRGAPGAGRLRRATRHQPGRAGPARPGPDRRSPGRRCPAFRCRRRNGSRRRIPRRSSCCRASWPSAARRASSAPRRQVAARRAARSRATRDCSARSRAPPVATSSSTCCPELRLLYALERHPGIARPVRFVNVAKKLERVRRAGCRRSPTIAPRKCGCARRSASARSARAKT